MICVELQFDGSPDRLRARARHRQRLDQLEARGDLLWTPIAGVTDQAS